MITVIVRAAEAGKFIGTAAGLEVTSRTPLFAMARKLIEAGLAGPDTHLEMRWAGSANAAMTGTAGALAKLTVREDDQRGPRIARWKAPSFGDVSRWSDDLKDPAPLAGSTQGPSGAKLLADVSSSSFRSRRQLCEATERRDKQ